MIFLLMKQQQSVFMIKHNVLIYISLILNTYSSNYSNIHLIIMINNFEILFIMINYYNE